MKNNGTSTYAIKGGNADSGGLTTWYSGSLPTQGGYIPMHQEGAIILGTGGDNSNSDVGDFFEGVMTAGYPTDAADNAVQANIVSVGYAFPSGGGATGTIVAGDDSADCVDNNNASANGNKVQMWDCDGNTAAQNWTVNSNGTLTIDGGCPGHHRRPVRRRHPHRMVAVQRRRQPGLAGGKRRGGQPALRHVPGRSRLQHDQRNPAHPLLM